MKDQNAQIIKEHAAKAFQVSVDDIEIVNRFLGGMSHLTYHIRVNHEDYTFRVIGADGNLFVDRKHEHENIKRIKPLGINNETVYFDEVSGDKAAKYIKGTILTDTDYKPHLQDVADVLKKLHQSGIEPASDYRHVERLALYETFTKENNPKYDKLKTAWIKIFNTRTDKPRVFCHGDAQRSNIILGKDHVYLLDWEYSGLNEIYYDIASFGNVQFSDALDLLDVYLDRKATKEEQDAVRFYRMFQALQWHQVATRKDMIGLSEVVHFDFKMLAEKYLNLAETLYNEIKG